MIQLIFSRIIGLIREKEDLQSQLRQEIPDYAEEIIDASKNNPAPKNNGVGKARKTP